MSMWIVLANAQYLGPFSTDEMRKMLREKRLDVTDLIWRKGMDHWGVVGKLQEFHPHSWSLTPQGEQDLAQVIEMDNRIKDADVMF